MNLTLHVWRQKSATAAGELVTYKIGGVSPNMSFIEMIDKLNRELADRGEEPVHYEADCLEGICGSCSMMINGVAHGPEKGVTTCQLHMRSFKDGDEIYIEPWRCSAFPIVKDLVVDRRAFDRIIQSGGYISVNTGNAPDANSVLVPKQNADMAFDAAQCIGCGACVASCKNGSAMLFVAAKVGQLALLPQGQPERKQRVMKMLHQMDAEGFGHCTNQSECEAVCPKEISVKFISLLNQEYMRAKWCSKS